MTKEEQLQKILEEKGAILFVYHPLTEKTTVTFPGDNKKYAVNDNIGEAINTVITEFSDYENEVTKTLNGCFESLKTDFYRRGKL